MGGASLIVATGVVTDLAQAPHFLRRLWALVVSLNIWLFVFGEWLFLAAIAGVMIDKGTYGIEHEMTKAWMRITLATLLTGAISL